MTLIILTGAAGCLILIVSHFLRMWQQQSLVRLILRRRDWVHPLDEDLRRVGSLERVEYVLASLERRGEVVRSIRGSYWRYRTDGGQARATREPVHDTDGITRTASSIRRGQVRPAN